MSQTTIFRGYPSSGGIFKNYIGAARKSAVELTLISGEVIPSHAIINNVTFSCYAVIFEKVKDNFYVYDLTNAAEPYNNGNYWADSSSAPQVSIATEIEAPSGYGNVEGTFEFTGVDKDHKNYSALVDLITPLMLCVVLIKYNTK